MTTSPGPRASRSLPTLALASAVVALLMTGVAAAEAVRGIPPRVLMGDPAAVVDGPFYLGAITLLRTGLLAGASTVCLTAWFLLRSGGGRAAEFLGALGLFGVVLVLDDKFQGHEAVLAGILGVPEAVTYAAYGLLVLAGAWRYGRVVLRLEERLVLVVAAGCLGFGAVADVVGGPVLSSFVETTAELAGIVCLSFAGLRISAGALRVALEAAPNRPAGAPPGGRDMTQA